MTEPAGSDLFPTPEPVEADRQRDVTTGRLPSQMLREAVALGREILSPQPIGDDQIQPASHDHGVSGLIEKRREIAGIIDELQRRLDRYRADLTHIDGVLHVLATNLDPEKIKPKRVYRRNRYFARMNYRG